MLRSGGRGGDDADQYQLSQTDEILLLEDDSPIFGVVLVRVWY